MDPTSDVQIRMVKVLSGRAREIAKQKGFKDDDLVIVKIKISKKNPLPQYTLERIEGNPVEYLQTHLSKKANKNGG